MPVGFRFRARLGCRGSTALEFAFVAMPALTMMFGVLAIGIIGMFQQVLDNAVRDVTRQVQIYSSAAQSSTAFKVAICNQLSVLTDPVACTASTTAITYSVNTSTPAMGFAGITPASVQSNGTLNNNFFSGAAVGPGTNVLVQVCWQLPFSIPFMSGLITAGTGGNCLYGIGATQVEPY